MKKIIVTLMATVLFTGACTAATYAHGHRRTTASFTTNSIGICKQENCLQAGEHWHDGICYNGHTADDGYNDRRTCGVSGCVQPGSHQHNNSSGKAQTHHNNNHVQNNNNGGHKKNHSKHH